LLQDFVENGGRGGFGINIRFGPLEHPQQEFVELAGFPIPDGTNPFDQGCEDLENWVLYLEGRHLTHEPAQTRVTRG
jgi:hypothetical protein